MPPGSSSRLRTAARAPALEPATKSSKRSGRRGSSGSDICGENDIHASPGLSDFLWYRSLAR